MIGIDFGTTNTGAALFDGRVIRPLLLDPESPTPIICRSAVYMTRTGEYFLGSSALNTYFEQNVGRPTRYRKVRVGEIIQVFAELPTFYRDVFVYEDEFSPGRLFTSIKTALRNREYFGTAFLGSWYTASDLVAVFLIGVKMQMERNLGAPVTEAVLGRPVHFSFDPNEDEVAQSRLLDAAFKAGFEKVYLEYEPVAAALSYELGLERRETVLVFDFGGGTLDFTIMRIGGSQPQQVLATGGIPIAGDIFDQRLFRAVIPPHLGEGGTFISQGTRYPIPAHIFDSLANPQEILALNTPQNLEMLRGIHQGAVDADKTHALLEIVSSNYALLAFDLVERTKRQLSTDLISTLILEGKDFTIKEWVTRLRFEQAITKEYELIRQELLATVDKSGLRLQEIDRVVRTGGSSQIPLFVELLNELFGPQKVLAIDAFSSVTAGLAVRGHQIASGQIELPAYTPDSTRRSMEQASKADGTADIRQVRLEVVQKRLAVRQGFHGEARRLPEQILFFLRGKGMHALDATKLTEFSHSSTAAVKLKGAFAALLKPTSQLILLAKDDQALLITSRHKFISARVADLYLASQAASHEIAHSLPLEKDEFVAAMTGWKPADLEQSFLVMITRAGQGRAFDARLLAEYVAKRPYFQLERRYSGIPAALVSAGGDDFVLAGTNLGRVAAASIPMLSVQPYDLLKLRSGERLSAVGISRPGSPLLTLSDQGAWLWLESEKFVTGGAPAVRGQTLRRNFAFSALFTPDQIKSNAIIGFTTQHRLLNLSRHYLAGTPLTPPATPTALQLESGEALVAYLLIAA